MRTMKNFTAFLLSLIIVSVYGQLPERKISKEDYISMYKEIAIEEMNTYRIPASITLAQGILESASGNSTLAKKANNHFGIKCHKGWNGKTYHMDDDARDECFRVYSNPFDSFKDHSIFLSSRDRYAFLFSLEITDYEGWAYGLKKAGYATNPKYPQLLIKIIEDHNLSQYDQFYNYTGGIMADNERKRFYNKKNAKEWEDFAPVSISGTNRKVYENNDVKFIFAKQGDTYYDIAKDFNIYTYQVRKYNELKKKEAITEGQIIYIEKKNNEAKETVHIVSPGETMYDISQMYAVRLKKLCKYNNLDKDAKLFPDQRIQLTKK